MVFFATSQDKSCVDSVGATIKRHVVQKIFQKKAVVKDVQIFYNCTKEIFYNYHQLIPILSIQKR